MIYLLLSILFSTVLLVIFKYFDKYKIDNLQAIVVNYFTAAISGFIISGTVPDFIELSEKSWFPFAFLIGTLFVSLFLILALSSQQAGLTITSVANKMSLVIPVTMAVFLYGDKVTFLKIAALLLAIIGVVMTAIKKEKKKIHFIVWLFPFIIFIGSGTCDTLVNYVEKTYLEEVSAELFTALLFSAAASVGLLFLLVQMIRRKAFIARKSIIGGIILGVPNYFSIHFLFLALNKSGLSSSDLFTVNNMGIVIASTIAGIAMFRERLSPINQLGLLLSLTAILLIYLDMK